jgi:hypothetical protein
MLVHIEQVEVSMLVPLLLFIRLIGAVSTDTMPAFKTATAAHAGVIFLFPSALGARPCHDFYLSASSSIPL